MLALWLNFSVEHEQKLILVERVSECKYCWWLAGMKGLRIDTVDKFQLLIQDEEYELESNKDLLICKHEAVPKFLSTSAVCDWS